MADDWSDNIDILGYLPRTIISHYRESSRSEVHRVSELSGVLVCVDAAGFTTLTKKLSEMGSGGPERLTAILNGFFDTLCAVVFSHDGDVLKFAGDALWAYFPESFSPARFLTETLASLQKVNSSDKYLYESPLTVHIGAEKGTFLLASFGIESTRLEAEPHGALVRTVYELCGSAGENDMIIGQKLARANRHDCRGETPAREQYRVSKDACELIHEPIDDCVWHPEPCGSKYLAAYIPSDILSRMRTKSDRRSLSSEHRSVTVLFANLDLANSRDENVTNESDSLNTKIAEAFIRIRELGGTIARIDPFEQGHKLLVLFGAPRRQTDDELRAVSCARRLLSLADDGFRIRAGLALGSLFCGDVGAAHRREYTVMGEAANTAARLMAKSNWGELLFDDELRGRLPKEIRSEQHSLALKGMGDNVKCHRLVDVEEINSKSRARIRIIGLDEELAAIRRNWEQVKRGESRVLEIIGESGIGKTVLCNRFIEEADSGHVFMLSCSQTLLFGHGWLARKTLDALLQCNDSASWVDIDDVIRQMVDEKWMPLFSTILGVDIPDNKWTNGLSGELRFSKTLALYRKVINAIAAAPSAILLDDYERADEFSKQLVMSLPDESLKAPLMIAVIGRERMIGESTDIASLETIEIGSPSKELWWSFFDANFEPGKRERELFDKLIVDTRGNRHCVVDFINNSLKNGSLHMNPVSGKWELVDASAEIKLPQSVRDVNLELFDRIDEEHRELLKVAAVAGSPFRSDTIAQLIGNRNKEIVRASFAKIARLGFLTEHPENDSFSFIHTSMMEAIYSCLTLEDKRRLHKSFATLAESQPDPPKAAILAYHFYQANCPKPAFEYFLRAAKEAAEHFVLTEAARYFSTCREINDCYGASEIPRDTLFLFYKEFTNSLVLEGKYSVACEILRKWRRTAKEHGAEYETLSSALETARISFRQSRYPRGRRVIESVLDHPVVEAHPDIRSLAMSILAEIERRSGNFPRATQLCRQAISLARDQKKNDLLTDAHNKLGLAQWGEGNLDDAAANFKLSLRLAGKDNSMFARAQTTNNLAIVHWELGDFKEASRLLNESASIFMEIGDRRNEAYSLGNLASLLRIGGQLNQSQELFLRADAIFLRLKDEHAHQYTVGNLGDLDLIRGRLSVADLKFSSVLDFARQVGDSELESECVVRFGDLAFFRREMTDAERLYLAAADKAESIGSNEYYLRAILGLARLNIYRKHHHKAARFIGEVTEKAKASRLVLFEKEADFLVGEQKRISGDFVHASGLYHEVLEYALDQNVFELVLKAAARISEVDENRLQFAQDTLVSLSRNFVRENDFSAWSELVESAYFSFFRDSLERLAPPDSKTDQLDSAKSL